jgi:hypothetical protein
MEDEGDQDEIADCDKEYQSDNGTSLVPDAPRPDTLRQTAKESPSIQGIATRGDKAEDARHQELVAMVHAESERLHDV